MITDKTVAKNMVANILDKLIENGVACRCPFCGKVFLRADFKKDRFGFYNCESCLMSWTEERGKQCISN